MNLFFPQLSSGAITQFPVARTFQLSNVINIAEDGSRYLLAGTNPPRLSWTLTYERLTQTEAAALEAFFQSACGRVATFTFLDPLGNALLWSEDLSQAVWQKSPLTSAASSIVNGFAVHSISGSSGASDISQTLPCPAPATICFALQAVAAQPVSITLSVSDASGIATKTFAIGNEPETISIAQTGTGGGASKTVRVQTPGGSTVQLSKLRVAGQPAPAAYAPTRERSGLLAKTRFDQDELVMTALGTNEFSCTVKLTSELA